MFSCLAVCGCSGASTSNPGSPSVAQTSSGVADSNAGRVAQNDRGELRNIEQKNNDEPKNTDQTIEPVPQTTKPQDQLVGQDSSPKPQDNLPKKNSDASRASPTTSSKVTRPKPPSTPSSEQLAHWAVTDHQPMELIACYDGFANTIVECMAIHPDGKRFVLGGAKLTLWNMADSKPTVDLIANHQGEKIQRPIRSIAISPNGSWLASGDDKGKLTIWNLSDQSEVLAVRAHDGSLQRLTFSPDSEKLATTSYSGEVSIWQVSNGKKMKSLKASEQEIARMEFLTDTLLATAGSEANIWNVESGKKETVLSTGYVIGPALGRSSDRRVLAYSDSDSKTYLWSVENGKVTGPILHGASAHLIDFSPDGKMIAIDSSNSCIWFWEAASGRNVQVIEGAGSRTVALQWIPGTNALLVASELGRVRIWGSPESAKSIGLPAFERTPPASISATSRRSLSSGHWQNVIDVRSFPRLSAAVPQWSDAGIAAYVANSSQEAAELFYRYYLGKSGWEEIATTDSMLPGMNFRKDGCELNVSMSPIAPATTDGNLQVSLQFSGNYDVRWLPRFSATESIGSWGSFSLVSYRTKAELTDVEVALLKQFHDAGWTAYTRLNSSSAEQPNSRSLSFVQGGSVLTVSLGYPADSQEEVFVQTSVNVSTKSLPIPPDSGWIEFDASTDLALVANTKMSLEETTAFFDAEMMKEGWMAREAGRHFKDEYGFLPYIRGQQDVLIRLVARPDSGTRIIVGDAERSSWQLQKPPKVNPSSDKNGIEVADFPLPDGVKNVKFDVDDKNILLEMPDITPPKFTEQFIKQFESLGWKRESAGLISDEYCFVTFLKGEGKSKSEIQIRIRGEAKKTTGMIGGNGLLWTKPLPTAPVRQSYESWLRRNRKDASLEQLDVFVEEMHKIPSDRAKKSSP